MGEEDEVASVSIIHDAMDANSIQCGYPGELIHRDVNELVQIQARNVNLHRRGSFMRWVVRPRRQVKRKQPALPGAKSLTHTYPQAVTVGETCELRPGGAHISRSEEGPVLTDRLQMPASRCGDDRYAV
jgi:hypothetical protein